jgi:hypothetical protein
MTAFRVHFARGYRPWHPSFGGYTATNFTARAAIRRRAPVQSNTGTGTSFKVLRIFS